MSLHVRPATDDDIVRLAPRLREADRQESLATLGEPLLALRVSRELSTETLTVAMGTEPLAMFGWVAEDIAAQVWMVGSNALLANGRTRFFLHAARRWTNDLQERFPLLWNTIDARNTTHIRWLKWMGFTFIHTGLAGPLGLPFHTFVRIKPCAYRPPH